MSDDKPARAKHGTSPGFGPPTQPLSPLEVQPIAAMDDTLAASGGGASARPPDGGGKPALASARGAEADPQSGSLPLSVPMPIANEPRRAKGPPAVDIDLVHERRTAPLPDQPWIFLEVWTRNTIYQLDASLRCVDVIDQGTRKSIGAHPLLTARLVGGQSRDGEAMELSHPFPRPGSEAVFEQVSGRQVRFSQTSTVTRVVMRLRVLTVDPEQLLPAWEDVSGQWDASGQLVGRPKKK
jgi:hypothetical protein